MNTLRTALAAAIMLSPLAKADYAMAPIEEVLRTVPIVVDATVTHVAKDGAVRLDLHRVFRGAIDGKDFVVSQVHLSCVRGAPGYFGAKLGKRYVFLLQHEDTLFEGSTMYEITGGPDALRVRHPVYANPAKAPLTIAEFEQMIAPAKAPKEDR